MEKHSLLIFLIFFCISAASASPPPYSVYESLLKCFTDTKIPATEASRIIYSPQNASFSSVLESYIRNRRFNVSTTLKPSAIITPTAELHVSAAVTCSKKLGILLKIRSGGHDYEGLSYTSAQTFVIIDMFNFKSIDVNLNDRTAWVESGALLGELYYSIWKKSNRLAFPGGVCPTLGVGGHITGGGYGNLVRKYGLTVDNVVDARIVDAGGRILDRTSMGEDLFWAIRGGGAASFGVILANKVKLVPVPEKVTVFRVEKGDDEDGVDAAFQFQELGEKITDDLFIRALLQPVSGNETLNRARVVFMGMFLGNSEQLLTITGSEFPKLGLKRSDCVEMPWINSVLFWVDLDNTTSPDVLLNRNPKSPDFFRRKSDYVKEPIPKLGLKSLLKKVGEGNVGLAFNLYGGVMSRIPENTTAFPHRVGNLYKVQYAVNWKEEGEIAERKYTQQIRELFDFMTPFVSKNPREAFLNYRDLDIGVSDGSYEGGKVYGVKYFKDNFDRLVKIKTRVDPDNFFRNEQSIPVEPPSRREV